MSSEAEQLLDEEQPTQYNFMNWDEFWRSALRYHNKVHPSGNLVIDRMNTLRQFMPESAIDHLGAYMKPHPRYRTPEGWDEWIAGATGKLAAVDKTIKPHKTARQWLASFKSGSSTEQELWHGLDSLVANGDFSNTDQRDSFFTALSWEAQARLEKRCPYFNPSHDVWVSKQRGVCEIAEQKIARIMELAKSEEYVAKYRRSVVMSFTGILLLAVSEAVLVTVTIKTGNAAATILSICTLVACVAGITGASFLLAEYFEARTNLGALESRTIL